MSIKICYANQKGGVAKSTTCISSARALALDGNKVLVVDTDQQGNATSGLGVTIPEGSPTLFNLLMDLAVNGGSVDARKAIVPSRGVDVLPSDWQMAQAELSFVQLGKESMLRSLLASVEDDYDYILIDTPPNLGFSVLNSLTAADWLVIPCTPTMWGNAAINELVKTIAMVREYANGNLKIAGILMTDADLRTNSAKANRSITDVIANSAEIPVFETVIPHSVKVREASDMCSDIITMDPGSKPAIAYKTFGEELARKVA